MAEAKCTHPPRGEADAYHIAEFISRDEKTAADMLYQRVIRERKLTRAEAAMLATMALRFSIKYQHNFERKILVHGKLHHSKAYGGYLVITRIMDGNWQMLCKGH